MSFEKQIPDYKTGAKSDGLWIIKEAEISQSYVNLKLNIQLQNRSKIRNMLILKQIQVREIVGAWQ